MRLVSTAATLFRAFQLNRELRTITHVINSLPRKQRSEAAVLAMRELAQAGKCEFPHLYGTDASERYKPWGSGTERGLQRARSSNPQVRLRGIGLWLAVAFHETRDVDSPRVAAVHRDILCQLRQLKEVIPNGTTATENLHGWPQPGTAAA